METPQPKSAQNRKVIVGVVIVILLCCCLMAVAVAGYYGWQAYQATQAAIDEIENLDIPSEIPTDFPSIPGFTGAELPQGGRSDDVTRATAWGSLLIAAYVFDCPTPTVEGTTIEVIQEPDANGVWVESWNAACGDGTTKPFKITFTPQGDLTGVEITPPE